jgi:NAD(P)-dependent dehydrogenase (short-subunit alcohol dehydrogenase family)/uncharacterized OB-fold protein
MIPPLERPKRKNPVLRTRLPTLPPATRSRVALGMTAGAARGDLQMQVCQQCRTVQYPPREACRTCLSDDLRWEFQVGFGKLIAETRLHHSQELYFRERTPWRIGIVQLDAGPSVIAHLHGEVAKPPTAVRVIAQLDRAGQVALMAIGTLSTPQTADDPGFREMTSNPKFRKVLVTDGKSAIGHAIVEQLAAAGADLIWAGITEPWKRLPGTDKLAAPPQVVRVPLDVTNERSVKELAAEIGGKVDILINTSQYHQPAGIGARPGTDAAHMEMEVNYLGLLRLAQAFGPALRARGADGTASAVAWVNLLSVFALSNLPNHGTFSASMAAAYSLSQCLRAEMQPAGIRVVNVFPGPIDDEWHQLIPPPKIAPAAVATAVIGGLRTGLEDIYPGDVAQEWLARWLDDSKALERELAR